MAACEWGHKKFKECDVQICMHGETNSTKITERFRTLDLGGQQKRVVQ